MVGLLSSLKLQHDPLHLCIIGALFGRLGQVEVGSEIARSCHEAHSRSVTKLAPAQFSFDTGTDAIPTSDDAKGYYLTPESAKSYFVLWRLTHDPKYREWGWELAQV